jgi:hypothetical protein
MEVIGQLHAPAALAKGVICRYPLNRWLAKLKSRSGLFGEEENLLPLPELEP